MSASTGKGSIPCTVCGATLISGAIVVCGYCGSEYHFAKPSAGGALVRRGSTPAGRRVIELLVAGFMRSHKVDLKGEPLAMQRLAEAAERAAREISAKGKAVVNLPFIAALPTGPLHLEMKLKRSDLD
jgi:hypothetical protein